MCGFAGILHRGRLGDAPQRVKGMTDTLVHRGPDDDGYWSDDDISLGFRRLAIVDLKSGHQPMSNADGSIWVVFNGEIYNHPELRRELQALGHVFATEHSDTEVLVHGYRQWGEGLVDRLNGMFAFAIWDRKAKSCLLARDRLGVKPLYIAEAPDGALVFASEIRAIHRSGLTPIAPDDRAVRAYFLQQNVWQDQSLFKGVKQLSAGRLLCDSPGKRATRQFWDFGFRRTQRSPQAGAEALREALDRALRRQLAADVPVKAYLSGGIDSSAIVAGAHKIDDSVSAYSCIFNLDNVGEDKFVDEREFSRAVAADLGIEHTELELPQSALTTSLHRTVSALEEPRMGMAYVNFLIAERAAQDCQVVLSGCGGDEILGGYVGRYAHLRRPYDTGIPSAPPSLFARLFQAVRSPRATGADPFRRMIELYSFPVTPYEDSTAFTESFRRESGEYSVSEAMADVLKSCPSDNDWDRLLYLDAKTYLAGLLMVEDKLSMAHSLETRVPLLDNEIIDLALTFDWSLLTDGDTGKIVFRNAIRDWVPPLVADKPKMGFGPPDASWYRGALQPYVRKILAPHRIKARGVMDPDFVSAAIESHMSGAANKLPLIWSLMSFDAWCELYGFYGGDLGEPLRP